MTNPADRFQRPTPERHYGRIRPAMLAPFCLLALTACAVEIGPRGPYPSRVYTELHTELVFNGKRVVVKGITECKRSGNFTSRGKIVPLAILDSTGPIYNCSPQWFGKRLPGGGAFLVGAYSVTGKWGVYPNYTPPDLTKHRERIAKVPRAVIWLDDAEHPTRGEYYYSAIALEDPRSRLTEIKSKIVDVYEDYGRTPSDPADEVPWVGGNREPGYLSARYANMVPKALWSRIAGLRKALSEPSEPVILHSGKGITQNQARALNSQGLALIERPHPYLWPRPKAVVFGLGFGRSSKRYFEQSLRRKAVRRDADDVVRFIGSLPKGVLLLVGKDGTGLPVGAEISNKLLKPQRGMWLGSYYYDPRTGEIYRFFGFGFNNGKDGHVYR